MSEYKFLRWITAPLSKLIAFILNVIISSVLCNILVLDSTEDNKFKLKLLLQSKYFVWISIYLCLMLIYFIYAYNIENKIKKEYIDLCSTSEVLERLKKEKYINIANKYDEFANKAKSVDELEKVILSWENVESRWNNED